MHHPSPLPFLACQRENPQALLVYIFLKIIAASSMGILTNRMFVKNSRPTQMCAGQTGRKQ
jgi:hypothetical protein